MASLTVRSLSKKLIRIAVPYQEIFSLSTIESLSVLVKVIKVVADP